MVGLLPRFGGDSVRTPYGQSGSFLGLMLVPAEWRCLVPGERRDGAQSRPPVPRQSTPGHIPLGRNTLGDNDASRWAFYRSENRIIAKGE